MSDLRRAVQAFQLPHTRRALLLGLPMLLPAFGLAALSGSGDWLLLRAAACWVVGTGVVAQWRLAPLVHPQLRRRSGSWLRRWGREPLGAMLLGIVALLPLAALIPLLPLRRAPVPLPAGEWQLAAVVGVLLGGMVGLGVWEQGVGRAGRRHAARREARERRRPSGAV
jgi:drug/metabolite transporter (DMT)-like permease